MKQRIGTRLMAGFALLFLVMTTASAVGLYAVRGAQRSYEQVAEREMPLRAQIAALAREVYQMSDHLRGYGLYEEEAFLTAYQTASVGADVAVAQALALDLTADERAAVEELSELVRHFKIINQSMEKLSAMGGHATAIQIIRRGTPLVAQFTEKAEALQAQVDRRAETAQTRARQQATLAIGLAVASGILGLVASMLLAWWLTRSITRPIRGLVAIAAAVAQGDLTAKEMETTAGDEISDLAQSLSQMITSLRRAIRTLQTVARQLVESSGELNRSASESAASATVMLDQLEELTCQWETQVQVLAETERAVVELQAAIGQVAGGAREQAAVAGDAADRMAQVAAQVQAIAQSGAQVATGAQLAYQQAATGDQAVAQVATALERAGATAERSAAAMADLSALSARIDEMTRLIEGIAGQTSLLALNAAIEAARAGESGRGFAVVAQEVGSLAGRSNQAARSIAELVKAIQDGASGAASASTRVVTETRSSARDAAVARAALDEILREMRSVVSQTEGIATGARQIAAHTELASQAVSATAAFSAQAVAATTQMAGSADRITQTMRTQTDGLRQSQAMAAHLLGGAATVRHSVATVQDSARTLAATAAELDQISARFTVAKP